jgi:hypothetical protein
VCAVAYVIAIDTIERRVLADRTGMIMANSMSETPIELPDPDEARARFDRWLTEPPERKQYDPQRDALELALGLR